MNLPTIYRAAVRRASTFEDVGALLARLSLGAMFAVTGWGKLGNLDGVTSFFQSLGIPAAGFHAHLVATTEFAGGIALVLGLGTRLAAIPLAITMTVAILTAKLGDVDGVLGLLGLSEFTYFAVLVWLALSGPGKASLDALIARRVAPGQEDEASDDGRDGRLATQS